MTTSSSPPVAALPALEQTLRRIRDALEAPVLAAELDRVAAILTADPPTLDVLTVDQRAADPEQLTSRVVHAESAFSAVALVMAPGQATTIHDHLTWCVVTVLAGVEHEVLYANRGDHLEVIGASSNGGGTVTAFAPPGDIHQVQNCTEHTAISLHVYGVDVRRTGSSVRRTYSLPVTDPASQRDRPTLHLLEGTPR